MYVVLICITIHFVYNTNTLFFKLFLFFLRLSYNYIIFPFHFLPPNSSIYPSLLSFKFMTFFINCSYMHTWIYTYTYILHKTYSVHIMLFVCLFSGLTIRYWVASWFTLSWGRLFLSLSQHQDSLVNCRAFGVVFGGVVLFCL